MKKYAIALYDNEAESEDELNFKKNDLFQIMQIDYEGMEGWWLCRSLKTNLVGLAAGNRLKLVTDEKILFKLANNLSEKLSASSSSSSILSSNSSASSVKSIETDLQLLNLNKTNTTTNNNNTIKTPKKLILPPKNDASIKKVVSLTPSTSNEDDDYDYDIPENNQPTNQLIKQNSSSNDSDKESDTRKSTSPTIDSGISTCSLVSCNSDISIKSSKHLSSDEEVISLKAKFTDSSCKIQHVCSQITSNNLASLKQNSLDLKSLLHEFISDVLKRCKQEHASFHFDLNVFNGFKTLYRQLKEFYLYYETVLGKLNNLYNWNSELLVKESADLNELLTKIIYLNDLIENLKQLIDKNNLFDYHSQTNLSDFSSKSKDKTKTNDEDESPYEYEYDNNTCPVQSTTTNDYDDVYESIYDDYCQIDDDKTGNNCISSNSSNKPSTPSLTNCLTLKKNEEAIKREIRIATTNSTNETSRINMVDQMLLKFYLKHIEDNLSELKSSYDVLVDQFKDTNYEPSVSSYELEHKLAIYGHKLVFICDTLQRNLNNIQLKATLNEASNCLSDALKVYMIRVRSRQQQLDTNNKNSTSSGMNSKQSEYFIESLNNVLDSSNQFKKLIIKYYLKSY